MSRILPGETGLYALTDSRLSLGRPLAEVAGALLEAGIRIIQYREKKASMRQKYEDCLLLRELTNAYDACLIINDHVDLAILCRADGLHIGQDDLPPDQIRKLAPELIIGVSTHSPSQAVKAVRDGADYIGVGPIFPTKTKEDVVAPVGLGYLEWVVNNIGIPHVAIGGIKASNIGQVTATGARCCALVSELVGAPRIGDKVREVRAAMTNPVF